MSERSTTDTVPLSLYSELDRRLAKIMLFTDANRSRRRLRRRARPRPMPREASRPLLTLADIPLVAERIGSSLSPDQGKKKRVRARSTESVQAET